MTLVRLKPGTRVVVTIDNDTAILGTVTRGSRWAWLTGEAPAVQLVDVAIVGPGEGGSVDGAVLIPADRVRTVQVLG